MCKPVYNVMQGITSGVLEIGAAAEPILLEGENRLSVDRYGSETYDSVD